MTKSLLFAVLSLATTAATAGAVSNDAGAASASSQELQYNVRIYMGNREVNRTWQTATMRTLPGKQATLITNDGGIHIRIDLTPATGSPGQIPDEVDVAVAVTQDDPDGNVMRNSSARVALVVPSGKQRDVDVSPWTAQISRVAVPPGR
jgi:hypothetical protein